MVEKQSKKIVKFFSQIPKFWIVSASLFILIVLAFLDYLTGLHYGFSIYYLFSVLLLTWFVNLRAGITFSVLSIISWLMVRLILLSSEKLQETSYLVLTGEAAIQLIFLLSNSYILGLLKKEFELRVKQKEQLVELDKIKNFFIGMVAHDLRNPLSIIEMSSFTILDKENRDNLSQDQILLLESIYRKSIYMLKLIEDYLDVMKIEAGHLQINKSTYDYGKFIGDIVALNTIIANQKTIRTEILKENNIPMFSYDRNKISQVVSNLLINAINISKPNSTIKINLKVEDKNIVTEIVDTGTGINAEDINRLFEAFYRSKRASERGTGLGLTISKKIVEAHGGTIGFKNNIDVGSTFWFTIPLE